MKKSTINKISLILSSAALTVSMGSLILVTIYSEAQNGDIKRYQSGPYHSSRQQRKRKA